MAALSDHDRRDAESALRAEVSILVTKYIRRALDMGKVYIKEDLDEAARTGRSVDGTAIGRTAANRATGHYFGLDAGDVHPALEGGVDPADGFT